MSWNAYQVSKLSTKYLRRSGHRQFCFPHLRCKMATSSPTSLANIHVNASALTYTFPPNLIVPTTEIVEFHSAIPSYDKTQLIPAPTLAKSFNLNSIFLKDERSRFGLPSFKPLGISWAIRNALIAELSETLLTPIPSTISLPELATKTKEAQIKLIAATDGKLGRIVARLGKYFGVESINTRVFVAEDISENVKASIKAEGAEVIVVQGGFETAVREAWLHSVATDGVLISLEAEENYEDIPQWITQGYTTIFQELSTQLPTSPDAIILPVGVGGLAQAAISYYKSPSVANSQQQPTRIITVEPQVSACLNTSLLAGQRTKVDRNETIMKHLNYEEVAAAAWEILKDGVDVSTVVSDQEVGLAVEELKSHEGLEAGACGGAVVAGLKAILGDENMVELGLNEGSTVVLVLTDSPED